jgi:3'-phosphoadenosine 5'-phosphosulfate sulfotransferase (PAPS reductase)/FAD synthetase
MDNVQITIEEKDENILVHVNVNEQKMYPLVPIIVVETKDVISYLDNNNIKVGALIKQGKAHNKRNHNRMGTWIFEKKALDKSAKKVIIEEEKLAQPKPPRKRRTRSSKKKVSTEE